MADCDVEMCPNWGGDGRVCVCVLLGIDPADRPRTEWDEPQAVDRG